MVSNFSFLPVELLSLFVGWSACDSMMAISGSSENHPLIPETRAMTTG
jgi:hypothetical protein